MRKIMKKDILMFGSLLSLMSVSGAALAQNCTSPTRCAELGYKKSASDSKYFCGGEEIEGDDSSVDDQPAKILYSDGTISEIFIPSKTPVGIVVNVSGSNGFAVALEESSSGLEWSTPSSENLSCLIDERSEDAQMDFRGADNTSCIINYNSSNRYPAAEYCNEYKAVSSGLGSSGWYLPGAGELYAISSNREAIDLGLQMLAKKQFRGGYYWSSSESSFHPDSSAWTVLLGSNDLLNFPKSNTFMVRCVLAF